MTWNETVPDALPYERLAEGDPTATLNGGRDGLTPILALIVQEVITGLRADVEAASQPVPLAVAEVTVGTAAQLELTIPLFDLHAVRIVGHARSNQVVDFAGLRMRLDNADQTSDYFTQRMLRVISTTADQSLILGQSSFNVGTIAGDDMPSIAFGSVEILLSNLQGDRVMMHADTAAMTGGSGALWRTEINRGFATFGGVATIQLLPASGEFMAGTRFELWAP